MIVTQRKSTDFGREAGYNDKKVRGGVANLMLTNMLSITPRDLALEFDAVSARNPKVRVPVRHIVISLHPTDRPLADRDFRRVVREYLGWAGYTGCQFVCYRHFDTSRQHVHLVVNRVRPDRSVVSAQYDHKGNHAFSRHMEQKMGLVPAGGGQFGAMPRVRRSGASVGLIC